MPTLEQLQQQFCDAILKNSSINPDMIASSDADARLSVYRVSVQDNLRRALSITYPGIWMLLGEECANNVAYAFCSDEQNLPASGCLDDWGSGFADFLAHLDALQGLPYLKDFATYEWFKHLAYRAASQSPLDLQALQQVPEDKVETIRLKLLPSVYCLQSQFALDEILNVIENPDAQAIDLKSKPTYVVIARPENEVLTFFVATDQWLFINLIGKECTLGEALQQTLEQHPQFDLQNTLNFLLKFSCLV